MRDRPGRPLFPTRWAGAAAVALVGACVALQWSIDGNDRLDLRAYRRALVSGTHGHLYDWGNQEYRFLYPPFAALVLRPFLWIGEEVLTRAWLLASIALGLAALAVVVRRAGWRSPPTPAAAVACAALLLLSEPVIVTLRLGQVNPLLAALVAADVVLVGRRSRFGGIATGVAAGIKLTPLPLALAFVAIGRRRDGARAIATFVLSAALGALVMPGDSRRFWTDVLVATPGRGDDRADNASVTTLARLLVDDPTLRRVVWLLLVAAVVVATARRLRHAHDDVVGAVVVTMCAIAVVSPVTWVHHHWFAVAALALWAARAERTAERLGLLLGLVALFNPLAPAVSTAGSLVLVAFAVVTAVALPEVPVAHGTDDPLPSVGGRRTPAAVGATS